MADFSDSDESTIVEELISQTRDLCVLEQISAINCSGFSDSPLPSDLESRFRKLKSFPATNSKPPPYNSADRSSGFAENKSSRKEVQGKGESCSPSADGKVDPKQQSQSRSISFPANYENKGADFTPLKEDPDGQKDLKVKLESGKIKHHEQGSDLDCLTPYASPYSSMDEEIFAPCKQNSDKKRHLSSKSKPKLESASSPFGSSSTLTSSPSPPRKSGCFWCSPKKGSSLRKSRDTNQVKGRRNFDLSKHDDFIEDIGSFSMKEHQKILKKAMKEQERISREADKILQMAKQASARITTRFEDDLSDDDEITK